MGVLDTNVFFEMTTRRLALVDIKSFESNLGNAAEMGKIHGIKNNNEDNNNKKNLDRGSHADQLSYHLTLSQSTISPSMSCYSEWRSWTCRTRHYY